MILDELIIRKVTYLPAVSCGDKCAARKENYWCLLRMKIFMDFLVESEEAHDFIKRHKDSTDSFDICFCAPTCYERGISPFPPGVRLQANDKDGKTSIKIVPRDGNGRIPKRFWCPSSELEDGATIQFRDDLINDPEP